MLNNELNTLVRKAYKNNLLSMMVFQLAPLIRQFRQRNSMTVKITSRGSVQQSRKETSTIEPIRQQKVTEEFTGRSSSKLSSSIQIPKQDRRNTSPQKLLRILSISQEEVPVQLADVLGEISRIELETDMKPRCKTLSLKNIRINKQQLIKFLNRQYSLQLSEQIVKVLKVPQIVSFQQYQQWIQKIENLEIKQQIRICFLLYDIANQGEITTHGLIELLKENNNQAVESDILHMIKQTKAQISNQINNDVNKINSYTLPMSVLRVKLDQSVILQQRRQSVLSNDARVRGLSKVSYRNSIDLNVDLDSEFNQTRSKFGSSKKKLILITQINQNNSDQATSSQSNHYTLYQNKTDKKKKRSRALKDEQKISIDINGFINIWYPAKPNIFNDILRNLTSKS